MSSKILKPISLERSLSSANNVASAKLVRVLNPTASAVVLTIQYANTDAYANCTINPNTDRLVEKSNGDLLLGTGLLGVSVAYTD